MNGHQKRHLTMVGVPAAGALAGGVLATAAMVRAGLDCSDSGPGSCGSAVTPWLAVTVLAVAVAGLPPLVRATRTAPALEQSIVVTCCVAVGDGFAAVPGILATLLGAPATVAACVVMIVASGLLLGRSDLVAATGLCLLAGGGAWTVGTEGVGALLAPALLFWLAAGLIRIGSPPEAADAAGRCLDGAEKVASQVVRTAAMTK